VLASLIGLVAVYLIVRARHSLSPQGIDNPGGSTPRSSFMAGLDRGLSQVMEALRYLTTRHEWRYQAPWVLMIGSQSGGKSSLLQSIQVGRRHQLLLKEKRLTLPGSEWHFFDRGVLIDPASEDDEGWDPRPGGPAWQRFLRKLEQQRPERPLDALVLCIKAEDLLSGDRDRLSEIARENHQLLWHIQKQLGFSLPVYVLVTQCDQVQGFEAFWKHQDSRFKEMIGWSSPYALEHEFSEQWVDEAFVQLSAQLEAFQLAVAAGGRVEEPDDFFLFPGRLKALALPLRKVLGDVLKGSAYQLPFPCRGIYFTGVIDGAEKSPIDARGDVQFVDDLFNRRILAERHLAIPTRAGLLSRNRSLRFAQIGLAGVVVVVFALLGLDSVKLSHQVSALEQSLTVLDAGEAQAGDDDRCPSTTTMSELLKRSADVDLDLRFLTMPLSWLDRRYRREGARMMADRVFRGVIFPGLSCHLDIRGKHLVSAPLEPIDGSNPTARIDEAQRSLKDYMDELLAHETQVASYNWIIQEQDDSDVDEVLKKFAELYHYAIGVQAPSEIHRYKGKQIQAIVRVIYDHPLSTSKVRSSAQSNITARSERLRQIIDRQVRAGQRHVERLYDDKMNQRLAASEALLGWMNWVEQSWQGEKAQGSPCQSSGVMLREKLRALHDLGNYQLDNAAILAPFSDYACHIPALSAFDKQWAMPIGRLVQIDGDQVLLSSASRQERTGFERLLDEAFMKLPTDTEFTCRMPLRGWEDEALANAVGHLREYSRFRVQESGGKAVSDGRLYTRVAARQLNGAVDRILSEGQVQARLDQSSNGRRSRIEDDIRLSSRRLSKQQGDILMVLQQYQSLGFEQSYGRILACSRDFSHDMLLAIQGLADRSRLYQPEINQSVVGMSDDETVKFYRLGSPGQAKAYASRQLDRSQVLAGYATPYVTLLSNTESLGRAQLSNTQSAPYWADTIDVIEAHVKYKDPDTDADHLNRFIEMELQGLMPNNCADHASALYTEGLGNNLFANRHWHLAQQARRYCRDVGEAIAHDRYQGYRADFLYDVAGRFPFGDLDRGESHPRIVRDLLLDYAEQREELMQYRDSLEGGPRQDVVNFLDQIESAYQFFKTNLAAPNQVQAIQLKPSFRIAREQSVGDENLVRWSLSDGTDAVRYPIGKEGLRWRYGRPLIVELDWAADGPVKPAGDPKQTHLEVDGLTARFHFDGNWALFQMLERHEAVLIPSRDPMDGTGLRLELEVPQQKNGHSDVEPPRVRVFIELQMEGLDPQSGQFVPLTLPKSMPKSVPRN